MTGQVALEVQTKIAIVRFINPPEGLMDEGSEAGLTRVLKQLDAEKDVRVVIVTGSDDVFIRHYDVKILAQRGRDLRDRGYTFSVDRPVPEPPLHRALRNIENSEKIWIAAINGVAMGGGFELALACDIRYAQQGNYPIGLPESNLGLLPGAGGTQRLPQLIGAAKALELMLSGKTLNPTEAREVGLVNQCVDTPVLQHALEVAEQIAKKPAQALSHIKKLVTGGNATAEDYAAERTLFCDLMVSEEALQLMAQMNNGSGDICNPSK